MFYHFFADFADLFGPLRIFRYPSFRIPAAVLTSLALTLWLFPAFIRFLKMWQLDSSNVREDTPASHQSKAGTPTMGGLFILICVTASTLLWADLKNTYIWAVIMVLIGFGMIGFVDDYRKVAQKNSKGLPGKQKLLWQVVILFGVAAYLVSFDGGVSNLGMEGTSWDTRLSFPFVPIRVFNPDIGLWYLPFAMLVIMGTSNAVNLTDGLDGLAIGPTIGSSGTFLLLAYAAGAVLTFHTSGGWVEFNVADYLNMPHIAGLSEVAVVCGAMVGASIGFLWYNSFPATVFMGDVGSLALGGALGMIAVLTKNEFLSAIVHGIFLVETLSVITQVLSFKLRGKRVFKMAPIHHHFELKGWAEPKIIVRFWIISIMLALIALVTLKLR
jgi:phospho-N-acetylmuramoyl-pentapeptide-transferase